MAGAGLIGFTGRGWRLSLGSSVFLLLALVFRDPLLLVVFVGYWVYVGVSYRALKIRLHELGAVRVRPRRLELTMVAGDTLEEPLVVRSRLPVKATIDSSFMGSSVEPRVIVPGENSVVFKYKPSLSGSHGFDGFEFCSGFLSSN